MRFLILVVFLAAFIFFPNDAIAESSKNDAASCSIYDAVYKPHPEYKKRDLDFEMRVREPAKNERTSSRWTFFYFDAIDPKSAKRLSTLRMGSTCSMGISVCGIGGYAGQYQPKDQMKEFKTNIAFKVVALDKDFFQISFEGPTAPHAYIFPNTASAFQHQKNSDQFRETVRHFVRYETPDEIFPDFGGYDVWIFDRCSQTPNNGND